MLHQILTHLFYRLFKMLPSLEDPARKALQRIYFEKLDSTTEPEYPISLLNVIHDEGDEPENE